MFDALGFIFKGFIYVWMALIAAVPNLFMGALTLCIFATALTYFMKNRDRE